jgi:methionyl aminopeptidase
MVTVGSSEVYTLPDNWTVVTRDRSWAAHFEHTIVVRPEAAEILSLSGPEAAQDGARVVGL